MAVCCVSLRGSSLRNPDTTADSASDQMLGNAIYRYALKVVPNELIKTTFVGAAVIGDQRVTSGSHLSSEKLDLLDEHSGTTTVVDICLGTEGVNLFLIDKGGVKSQLHYGFDYGIKGTCDPKLFEVSGNGGGDDARLLPGLSLRWTAIPATNSTSPGESCASPTKACNTPANRRMLPTASRAHITASRPNSSPQRWHEKPRFPSSRV